MNIQKTNRKSQLKRPPRFAFTLIELLLVISIIAVLGTLAVGVIGSAQEDSRIAASRSRATLIQKAMEAELEDYEVRRSPVPFSRIGNLASQAIASGSWDSDPRSSLLHGKNLKRMIVADLIRSELPGGPLVPTGVEPNAALGQFPSATLRSYLNGLQISDALINANFPRSASANTTRWLDFEGFGFTEKDPAELAQLSEEELLEIRQADSSEILYEILSQLEFDGTNVIDSIGTAAIGDTDGDGVLEIIDGFGDPMAFEFLQRNLAPGIPGTGGAQTGVWVVPAGELEMDNFRTVRPVLPTDLRFYITSKNLFEIDGNPDDLQIRPN